MSEDSHEQRTEPVSDGITFVDRCFEGALKLFAASEQAVDTNQAICVVKDFKRTAKRDPKRLGTLECTPEVQ